MRIRLRTLLRWIESSSTSVVGKRMSAASLLSASECRVPSLDGTTEEEATLLVISCSTRLSKTEMMIAASNVSRKTIMKMGTEKTFFAILDELGYRKRGHVFGFKAVDFTAVSTPKYRVSNFRQNSHREAGLI